MKKFFVQFVLVLACMGLSIAYAEEKSMTKSEKDQCLLISKECENEIMNIQQKIKKLQSEIKKGKRVYTADELKKLQYKLQEINSILDAQQNPGQ